MDQFSQQQSSQQQQLSGNIQHLQSLPQLQQPPIVQQPSPVQQPPVQQPPAYPPHSFLPQGSGVSLPHIVTPPPPGSAGSFCNEELVADVGVVAASLKSIEVSETNHLGYKKRIVSSMHTDADKDVKQQALYPRKTLDNNWVEKPPEYYDLTTAQFGMGALVLYQLPLTMSSSPMANMLKHSNRLVTYAGFYSLKQVPCLHHNFLSAIEQQKKSWATWEVIQKWHNVNLKVMKSSTEEGKPMKQAKDPNKELLCSIELGAIKSSYLYLKFQQDNCAQDLDHASPNGGKSTLAHHFPYCFHKVKPHAVAEYMTRVCEIMKRLFLISPPPPVLPSDHLLSSTLFNSEAVQHCMQLNHLAPVFLHLPMDRKWPKKLQLVS